MTQPLSGRVARGLTFLTTWLLKMGGLVAALNEILIRPSLRPAALAEAAFMMAGAQLSETVALAALDRIMGREPVAPPREPPDKEKPEKP